MNLDTQDFISIQSKKRPQINPQKNFFFGWYYLNLRDYSKMRTRFDLKNMDPYRQGNI